MRNYKTILEILKQLTDGFDLSSGINNFGSTTPTKIENFKEDGVDFVKKTYTNEYGVITIVEQVNGNTLTENIETLENELNLAIEEENFEYAAELRDKIKNIKDSKDIENKVINYDEWNF